MALSNAASPPIPEPARVHVAIAASVGGVEATRAILRKLPADLPAAIAIVQHRTPTHRSSLARVLGAESPMHVVDAQEPATSKAPSMPESAIRTGAVHVVLPLEKIADEIVRLVRERAGTSLAER